MPLVSIIGRENVGKSTLFNRILKKRIAIETEIPGTTRDRILGNFYGKKIDFLLADTAGVFFEKKNSIELSAKEQTIESIENTDLILFCVDCREKLSAAEIEICDLLRKKNIRQVPIFLLANKAEKKTDRDIFFSEFSHILEISKESPFFISAKENQGISDLIRKIEDNFLSRGFSRSPKKNQEFTAKIAIVGQENTGKSTFLNFITGKNRAVVSEIPGTTRDQLDSEINFDAEKFLLIDTAGIRKASRSNRKIITRFSRMRSISAMARADVVFLFMDCSQPISHIDQVIAGEILAAGKGIVLIFSKWDLALKNLRDKSSKTKKNETSEDFSKIASQERENFLSQARKKFPFLSFAPVHFISSLEKRGIAPIFKTAKNIAIEINCKISTSKLNNFLAEINDSLPPGLSKKNFTMKFVTQTGQNPPRFTFFCNNPENAHFSAKRFLENRLRKVFGFWGIPILVQFRKK